MLLNVSKKVNHLPKKRDASQVNNDLGDSDESGGSFHGGGRIQRQTTLGIKMSDEGVLI